MTDILFDEGNFFVGYVKKTRVHQIVIRKDAVESFSDRSELLIFQDYLKTIETIFKTNSNIYLSVNLDNCPFFSLGDVKLHVHCLKKLKEEINQSLVCTAIILSGKISSFLFNMFIKAYGKPEKPIRLCKTQTEVETYFKNFNKN
tara:strand:- start:353 stop:787 length:435 start_codon:yes stop_codon:yes gene_type:complete